MHRPHDLVRVVVGTESNESYLLLKLEGRHLDAGGTDARMPLGAAALDETTVEKIRAWIASGAQDN
jgi:hypothetical protein